MLVFNVFAILGGLTGGYVSLLAFSRSNIPHPAARTHDSVVRIAVALNGAKNLPPPDDSPRQADGTTPAILAFSEIGHYIGWSDWLHRPHIGSGDFVDVTIYQDKGPGKQAAYLQLFAGTDAVCIAYISQVWADGQVRGWLGDMGAACGMPSYYSHIIVGDEGHVPCKSKTSRFFFSFDEPHCYHHKTSELKNSSHLKPFSSDCMWLDRDQSSPSGKYVPTAVQIHMQVSRDQAQTTQKRPIFLKES